MSRLRNKSSKFYKISSEETNIAKRRQKMKVPRLPPGRGDKLISSASLSTLVVFRVTSLCICQRHLFHLHHSHHPFSFHCFTPGWSCIHIEQVWALQLIKDLRENTALEELDAAWEWANTNDFPTKNHCCITVCLFCVYSVLCVTFFFCLCSVVFVVWIKLADWLTDKPKYVLHKIYEKC